VHAIIWAEEQRAPVYTFTSSTLYHNPLAILNMLQESVTGLFQHYAEGMSFKTRFLFILTLKQKEGILLQSAI
jgi:hypothetical protein